MAFDSNLPADHSPVVAAELRNQFNALKALMDVQQATTNSQQAAIGALQSQLGGLQTLVNQKVSMADVNHAITANSACNVDGVDEPLRTARSESPLQMGASQSQS
jgi:hypothetical protein